MHKIELNMRTYVKKLCYNIYILVHRLFKKSYIIANFKLSFYSG